MGSGDLPGETVGDTLSGWGYSFGSFGSYLVLEFFVEISGDNTYSSKPYLQSTRQLDRVEYWELRKYTKI
jgi:hypothetical protein